MSYLPFARKWRPQNFDEIIGQEHITTTLKNAISLNRVHHAYLFAGPRGIGKTSTARILSKALNCEKGPIPVPCNVCIPCQEITGGRSLDVIEIDGASNRGIDEIRNLRETVKFSPSKGRFKVYIIDEVHMLTPEAFNALLKTLEEPPVHVKFIFATTEPHRLPATILSRCQRFDFRRIPIKDIVAKLHDISKAENLDIDIEEEVFLYIAKAADGSMRDAESILDQVSSFSKGKIQLKDVVDSLGMIEQEILFRCTDLIINRDTEGVIKLIDELVNSGKDVKQFLSEMLEHFRNIMIAKVTAAASQELIELSKEAIERINRQSQSLSKEDVFYIISVISNSMRMMKQLLPERIVLELCMIKLTLRDSISSIEELLSKLPNIVEGPSNATHKSVLAVSPRPVPPNENSHHSVKHVTARDNPAKVVSADVKPSLDISRVNDAWPILVKAMAVKKMSISSYLSEGQPDSVRGDTVLVAFPKEFNFHREVLEEKLNKDSIESALSGILDVPIKLKFIAVDRPVEKRINPASNIEELKKKEPAIDAALGIFGGRILKAKNT